jgi:hypothetical protein
MHLSRPQPRPPRIARRPGGLETAIKAMRTHVGIDFGTSGARATVIDGEGACRFRLRGGAPPNAADAPSTRLSLSHPLPPRPP